MQLLHIVKDNKEGIVMEFATEEEMREYLGDDAKGFNTGFGYASRVEIEHNETDIPKPKVVIGAFVGNQIMYLAPKGTTFIKSLAKQFDNTSSTDTKVAFMNKKGCYNWKKIPVS